MPGQPPWFFLMAHSTNARLIPSQSLVDLWLTEIYDMRIGRGPSQEEMKLAALAAKWGYHQKVSTELTTQLFRPEDLFQKKVVDRIKTIGIPTINAEDPKEEWITLLDEKDILEILTAAFSAIEN